MPRWRPAIVGGDCEGGDVPGPLQIERQAVALASAAHGFPTPLEVVQALEALVRGQQDAHHARGELAQVVDHADEDAAGLVRVELFGEKLGRVAERLEEDRRSTWRPSSAPGSSPRNRYAPNGSTAPAGTICA